MNDPQNHPIDIEDQRAFLIDHKAATGMSWQELGKRTGIAAGTLSQFGSSKGYAGDEQRVAEQVYRYQQQLAAQVEVGALRQAYVAVQELAQYLLHGRQGQRLLFQVLQRPGTGATCECPARWRHPG